ncbi:cyclin-like protein [Ochromonadaceae sp. CCMP2298]|nr:cyclin-like protein [Ochromonadaceae sp. CCMP2298]
MSAQEEAVSTTLPSYVLERGTPSALNGVSAEEEKRHRVFGCELVAQAVTVLRLPHVVAITGQNILHRFFYRKSMLRFDVFTVAMGAVLLGAKVEEQFKTLREILFAFHHIYAARRGLSLRPMELGGQQYSQWKAELIMVERFILKELGFSLYGCTDAPHKYILYFVRLLCPTQKEAVGETGQGKGETQDQGQGQGQEAGAEELANCAWAFLNDSMRLHLCLTVDAGTIACAALFLAARQLGVPMPENEGAQWWVALGAREGPLLACCDAILSLYHMEKIGWLWPLAPTEHLSVEACARFDAELLDVEEEEGGEQGGEQQEQGIEQQQQQQQQQQGVEQVEEVKGDARGELGGQDGGGQATPPMALVGAGTPEAVADAEIGSEIESESAEIGAEGAEARAEVGPGAEKEAGAVEGAEAKADGGRDRDRNGDRDRDRGSDRHRERSRGRDGGRDRKDRDGDRSRGDRDRERSRDRGGRDRERDRDRGREGNRDRDRDREKGRDSRDRDRGRDRDKDRDKDRGRDRDRDSRDRGNRRR